MRFSACLALVIVIAVAGVCAAQSSDTNFASGPQYLITTTSTLFLRPIATPSLSFPSGISATNAETGTPSSFPPPAIQNTPDLSRILWTGEPSAHTHSIVEITSTEPTKPLPASLFDTGVTGLVTPQTLREQGIGVTPGEAAATSKSKVHAARVFTNADIQRFHKN